MPEHHSPVAPQDDVINRLLITFLTFGHNMATGVFKDDNRLMAAIMANQSTGLLVFCSLRVFADFGKHVFG